MVLISDTSKPASLINFAVPPEACVSFRVSMASEMSTQDEIVEEANVVSASDLQEGVCHA